MSKIKKTKKVPCNNQCEKIDFIKEKKQENFNL